MSVQSNTSIDYYVHLFGLSILETPRVWREQYMLQGYRHDDSDGENWGEIRENGLKCLWKIKPHTWVWVLGGSLMVKNSRGDKSSLAFCLLKFSCMRTSVCIEWC